MFTFAERKSRLCLFSPYVYMYEFIYVRACVRSCVRACVYVCMYVCMYVSNFGEPLIKGDDVATCFFRNRNKMGDWG